MLPAAEPRRRRDAALPAELRDVVDDQEVRGEAERLDGLELHVQPLQRVGGQWPVAPGRPLEAELGQVGERRLDGRQVGGGEKAPPQVEPENAGPGYLPRVRDRLGRDRKSV